MNNVVIGMIKNLYNYVTLIREHPFSGTNNRSRLGQITWLNRELGPLREKIITL